MIAADRRAAGAGPAFVAGCGDILKIDAAGALQQVAAGGREVAQLTRRPGEQGLGEHGVAGADDRVGRQVAVAHRGADPHAAVRQLLDPVERQPADVDQQFGAGDPELHVIDEVGAAAEEGRIGAAGDRRDRGCGIGGPLIGKGLHDAASRIAATMFT